MRFTFDATCPDCGGSLRYEGASRPHRFQTCAAMRCRHCNVQHIIVVCFIGPHGRVRSPL